jgi:alkanesulfonate monooxygenase SsuD/methylene tetrahydromethanopterin reductase-like flavin-dependent oxidoreductase (luciferase family)
MGVDQAPVGWLLTPGTTPIGEAVAHVELLESLGFESAWLGEAFREVVVPLSAAAARTSRIDLHSGILQIYPVHPVVVAQQAAQLAQLSGGRFGLGLGLGAGFVIERWFGLGYDRPLRRMREFLEVVRGVLRAPAEGPFSYEGEIFRVHRYPLPFMEEPVDVPLHIAAVGPQMQRLAGELADGIVVGGINSPAHLAEVQENLAIGAERAGRDVAEIDIVYTVPCAVWDDADRARELGKGSIVYSTQYPHYRRVWKSEGYEDVTTAIAERVRAHDMDAALALVTDEMMDRYAVAGTAEQCRAQLERYRDYPGRPILSLMPFRMSDEEIMASLRAAARGLPTHLPRG